MSAEVQPEHLVGALMDHRIREEFKDYPFIDVIIMDWKSWLRHSLCGKTTVMKN